MFVRLYIYKCALVGPPRHRFTLVLSPKMKANENKFLREEGRPT